MAIFNGGVSSPVFLFYFFYPIATNIFYESNKVLTLTYITSVVQITGIYIINQNNYFDIASMTYQQPNISDLFIITFLAMNFFLVLIIKYFKNELHFANKKNNDLKMTKTFSNISAGLCHEINNPLFIIKAGNNSMKKYLKSNDGSPKSIEIIHDIKYAAERIHSIIHVWWKFFSKTSFTSSSVIKPEELHQKSIFNKFTKVTVDGKQSEKELNIHLSTVQYIIFALEKNAYEAAALSTCKQEVEIKFVYLVNRLTIQVIDSGNGIHVDNLSLIWEPFFTTKGVNEGVGLDLTNGKNYLNHIGADLICYRKNSMTVFEFSLELTEK